MDEFSATYASVIAVTLVYLALYYATMIHVLRVKRQVYLRCRERGERFDRYRGDYPDLLAADRVQLNMLEHMPPFLALMWLQAVVVSPESAAALGTAYVLLRAVYPLVLGRELGENIPLRLLIVTFSGYGLMLVMAGWTLWTVLV